MGSESYASLKFKTTELSAEEISQTLNLTPTKIIHKGEIYGRAHPKKSEDTVWSLRSSLPWDVDLEKHIEELLLILEDREEDILTLSKTCDVSIWCFTSSESGQAGAFCTHDFLKRISRFPVDLVLDFYL